MNNTIFLANHTSSIKDNVFSSTKKCRLGNFNRCASFRLRSSECCLSSWNFGDLHYSDNFQVQCVSRLNLGYNFQFDDELYESDLMHQSPRWNTTTSRAVPYHKVQVEFGITGSSFVHFFSWYQILITFSILT